MTLTEIILDVLCEEVVGFRENDKDDRVIAAMVAQEIDERFHLVPVSLEDQV